MPQNKKNHQSSHSAADASGRLHAAALRLAAAHGWIDLTLAEVYAEAGLALPHNILHEPAAVWGLVDDILASLDARVHADVADRLGDSWRDNLFELIMTRFDLMQADRLAYADIMPAALNRACAAGPKLSRRMVNAMHETLAASGLDLSALQRPLAVASLTAIYLSLLEVWRRDDSPDLAKTMAAVDKRIGWFESLLKRAGAK